MFRKIFDKSKRDFPLREQSERSAFIYKSQTIFIIAVLLMFIAIPSLFMGMSKYNYMLSKSSSPIGTNLVFQRSGAVLTIKNIFTTKSKNALIVRMGANDQSSGSLPFKGEDFAVYLRSERISKQYPNKFMKLLFGKISTDGDFFLIIPKPDPNNVYEVMIMNKKYLPSNIEVTGIDSDITKSDVEFAGSLTKALANQSYKLFDEQSQTPTIASNEYDMGAFRVALNPSLDSEKYKPIQLDVDLLSDDGEFDFELFFEKVFKENTVKGLDKEFSEIKQATIVLRETLAEMDERLLVNPKDAGAIQKKTEITKNLETMNNRQKQIIDLLDLYEVIKYNPGEHFNYLLDYGYVLPY